MDIGVFIPITNNGWIVSTTSPRYMPTFDLNKEICLRAEEIGFDFALSMVKFRGLQGATEYWDYALEAFTLIAGLAEATTTLDLYASVAVLTMHPAMIARMAVTIDSISHGRFGVNMVAGWNKYEYSPMGLWPTDEFYDQRYDYATEYVSVMRQLWESGRVTHKGQFFELDDCFVKPLPTRRIPIVCAGQSARGMRYAAEVGDHTFVYGSLDVVAKNRALLDIEVAKTGRDVGMYALFGIITAPTDAEAEAVAREYMRGTDHEALANVLAMASGDKSGGVSTLIREKAKQEHDVVFPDDGKAAYIMGGCFGTGQLIGSFDRIAASLDAVELEAGAQGVVLTFPEFVGDIKIFGDEILPRMKTRGRPSPVHPAVSA